MNVVPCGGVHALERRHTPGAKVDAAVIMF